MTNNQMTQAEVDKYIAEHGKQYPYALAINNKHKILIERLQEESRSRNHLTLNEQPLPQRSK